MSNTIESQTSRTALTLERGHSAPLFSESAPAHYNNFKLFHRQNPAVYKELRQMALNLRRNGLSQYSIKGLFEVLRYQRSLIVNDKLSNFKINNNYTSFYARELMKNEPSLKGFFRIKKSPNHKAEPC